VTDVESSMTGLRVKKIVDYALFSAIAFAMRFDGVYALSPRATSPDSSRPVDVAVRHHR